MPYLEPPLLRWMLGPPKLFSARATLYAPGIEPHQQSLTNHLGLSACVNASAVQAVRLAPVLTATTGKSIAGYLAMIKALLVDDQALVRKGLLRILNQEPDITVVGECEDGDEVVAEAQRLQPDIVLMDVRMKRMDGISVTKAFLAQNIATPVMMLTTFGSDDVLRDALAAGAAGFVLKDASTDDLIRATQVIASGGAWLDPAITDKVLDHYRHLHPQHDKPCVDADALTAREREVLLLIAEGLTNQEIAGQLVVSEATIKTHISHIFSKLGARDRAAAIVYAYDHGIVMPRH